LLVPTLWHALPGRENHWRHSTVRPHLTLR
jgi:hypothetical protein